MKALNVDMLDTRQLLRSAEGRILAQERQLQDAHCQLQAARMEVTDLRGQVTEGHKQLQLTDTRVQDLMVSLLSFRPPILLAPEVLGQSLI